MTEKQDKAPWELEVEKALETGDADAITPDLILLGLAKEAFKGETPGARASNLKTLALSRAMLVQVIKDDGDSLSDEQIAQTIADKLAPMFGLDHAEVKQKWLEKMRGKK